MKRTTLIRSLKKIVGSLDRLDLPVTVEAFYGYGSALRGKKNPGDLDLVLVYSMTPEQEKRWESFKALFEGFVKQLKDISLWEIQSEMSFPDYLSQEPVNHILEEFNIVPEWAKTYSWSNTINYHRTFFPHLQEVTLKLLLNNIRGIQIFHSSNITEFKPFGRRDNYYLLWTPEKPDIDENFKQVPSHEIVLDKIDDFINDYDEEKEKLMKIQPEILEISREVGLEVSFDNLNSLHPRIKYRKTDGKEKIQGKCELARTDTKRLMTERQVLHLMRYVLENWSCLEKYESGSKEEKFVLLIMKEHQETYLKEKDIRTALQILDLPENHVVTRYQCWEGSGRCGKDYLIESDPLEREKIIKTSKIEKKRDIYISSIRRSIQKINKRFRIWVEMEDIKPKSVDIYFIDRENEDMIPYFEERDFSIEKYDDRGFFAETNIPLNGNETNKEIIDKALITCT